MNNRRTRNRRRYMSKNKNKNKTRTYKAIKSRKMGNKPRGGAAVKAGSYGCVFSPNLKCENGTASGIHAAHSVNEPEMISKLMYKRDAENELNEVAELNLLLKKIPNQEMYFLSNSTYSCSPQRLSSNDLDNFETCNMLVDENITKENVNNNLGKLSILNMKNGGVDMDEYLRNSGPGTTDYLKIINENLIKLLKFGIIPLNLLKFNHYDVKSGNVLINDKYEIRLIDWGLASSHDGKHIPRIITNRSFAFNIPYSIIFFNEFIKGWIHNEYKRHNLIESSIGKKEIIRIISINLVNFIIHKHSGHETTIVHIMRSLYREYIESKEGVTDKGFISSSIASANLVEYIYTVMLTYTNDLGVFDDVTFFHEIFAFNSDIFGFIIIYESILNTLNLSRIVRDKIIKILLKYCVGSEFAAKRINIDILVNELEGITK